MAQPVKCPTLELSSGHDLTTSQFVSSSPAWGSALMVQSLLGILSLPLSAPPQLVLSLSLSQNK